VGERDRSWGIRGAGADFVETGVQTPEIHPGQLFNFALMQFPSWGASFHIREIWDDELDIPRPWHFAGGLFYPHGVDDERNLRELLSHFDKNARVDFGLGEASVFQGEAGLETFLGKIVPVAVSFCMHMAHNPVIEMNGDTATGEWYYEVPATDASSNRAQWMAGTYFEQYLRREGEWKFASIRTEWKYISPHDEGWAKNRGEILEKLGG
jgi:hypothetical protein